MIYADNVVNITIVGPNARLRFDAIKEVTKEKEETKFQTEEAVTLVLPVPALGKLAEILENLKQQIEQQRGLSNKSNRPENLIKSRRNQRTRNNFCFFSLYFKRII